MLSGLHRTESASSAPDLKIGETDPAGSGMAFLGDGGASEFRPRSLSQHPPQLWSDHHRRPYEDHQPALPAFRAVELEDRLACVKPELTDDVAPLASTSTPRRRRRRCRPGNGSAETHVHWPHAATDAGKVSGAGARARKQTAASGTHKRPGQHKHAHVSTKPLFRADTEGADGVDRRLRKLVPERVLALDRAAFCEWKRGRKLALTKQEATRLAQYRRQMLARVYAERARQARNEQHRGVVAEVARLTRENTALHIRVAELERLVACFGGTMCR